MKNVFGVQCLQTLSSIAVVNGLATGDKHTGSAIFQTLSSIAVVNGLVTGD